MSNQASLRPTIHASCVAIDGIGVLIRGPSGAGKSDLALRLIDRGAELVTDDRAILTVLDSHLVASAPPQLAGKLEVYGLGIVDMPHRPFIAIGLVCDLVPQEQVERMPEPRTVMLDGIEIRFLTLYGRSDSAPAKVRLAVGAVGRDRLNS